MKDEIKKILDNIRKIIKSNREDDFNRIIYDCDSIEKLLDYITYLQEDVRVGKELIAEYKQENERLKENNQNMQVEMSRSWERIDKAIEYINAHKVSDTITFPLMKKEQERDVKNCYEYEFEQIYKKELLNILKGE